MAEKITSLKNPKIVHVRKLIDDKKYRNENKEFVVEGKKLVEEVSEKQLSYVLVSDKIGSSFKTLVHEVPDTLLKKVSATEAPQGVLAVVKQPVYSLKDVTDGKWIIAEGIQDPGNLGNIIRTIEAAGAQGLIYTSGTVDPFSPKVVRSSAGSVLRMPLLKVKSVAELKKVKPEMKLIASKVQGGKNYKDADLSGFCGIILGCEGQGMTEEACTIANERITIPLKGKTESLNVATTAAVILFNS